MSLPRGQGSVTIDDVARAANVSRATVSRVMNGKESVDRSLAERVRDAANLLQYRPSSTARNLSLGRTHTVAIALPDLTNPMFQEILRGATTAAGESEYRVLVADTAGDPEREAASALDARRRCDAIMLVAPRMPEPTLRQILPALSPVVVINREPDGFAPTLQVDYRAGIHAILEHLVSLGHRDLLYLSGPELSASNRQRLDALRAFGAARENLRIRELPAGATIEAGWNSGEQVLASGATAVVAYNDLIAFGLLGRLNMLGVAVPGDISITGFDDIAFARFAQTPLTTAAVPQARLGTNAWEHLEALLRGERLPDPTAIVPELVIRASSGVVAELNRRRPQGDDATVGSSTDRARFEWTTSDSGLSLRPGGAEGSTPVLARAHTGEDLPLVHAPRPYLHPVRTLSGFDLTDHNPQDHRHHYGVSLAIPLANGSNFWGGRTFVRDTGPTLLHNHGRQEARETTAGGAALSQTVEWAHQDGSHALTERRNLTAGLHGDEGWVLQWISILHADTDQVVIESPTTHGRPNAGFGGIFWRVGPATEVSVFGPGVANEYEALGSVLPWIAFNLRRGDRWASLVLSQHPDHPLPWFVRATDWPGACPALAWSTPLVLAPGEKYETRLAGVAIDRRLTEEEASVSASKAWNSL